MPPKGGLGTAEKRRKLQTKCLQESSRLNQVLAEKEAELTQVNRELAQKRKQLEALGPERGGKAAASSRAVCAKAGHSSEPAAAADRRQPRVLLGFGATKLMEEKDAATDRLVPALIERLQQVADVRIVHTKLAERCFPELIEQLSPAPAKGGMLPAVWGDDDREEDPTGAPARENVQWADMLLIAPATTDLVGDIVGRLETGLLTEIVCNWPVDREQLEGARDQMSQSLLKEAPKHAKPIILVPAVNSWQYASMVRRRARAQKPPLHALPLPSSFYPRWLCCRRAIRSCRCSVAWGQLLHAAPHRLFERLRAQLGSLDRLHSLLRHLQLKILGELHRVISNLLLSLE